MKITVLQCPECFTSSTTSYTICKNCISERDSQRKPDKSSYVRREEAFLPFLQILSYTNLFGLKKFSINTMNVSALYWDVSAEKVSLSFRPS